ncbi:MAG TPA: hypothetical protein VMT74_01140 [Gaiellaceae bacterium]|nr:hypothetical protein [Gaiellaceae bacterium]
MTRLHPQLEIASRQLDDDRRSLRARSLLAVLAALACIPLAFLLSPRPALVVGVAAGCEAVLAGCSVARRRMHLRRLALDPDAYAIDDVRRYGVSMIKPARRAALARSLLRLGADAAAPHTLLLRDRVAEFGPDLDALARELESPEFDVEPTSAVACCELLTNGVESALYNPDLPDDDLAVAIHHIRAGIRRREPTAARPASGSVERTAA